MANPISDAVILDVLDRACVLSLPLLDALREDFDDPADVLAEARRTGPAEGSESVEGSDSDSDSVEDNSTAALPVRVARRLMDVVIPDDDEWAALPEERRRDWWVSRISNVASLASGLPRLAGRAADLLPLRNALGAAVQALAVLAVARERGIRGREQQVSLLARILIERELPPARVREILTGTREREANIYREEAFGTPQSRRLARQGRHALAGGPAAVPDRRRAGRATQGLAGLPSPRPAPGRGGGGRVRRRTGSRPPRRRAGRAGDPHRGV